MDISTEETEDSTLYLCYNGNVNTKIAISMYCECQSVEIEEYIFHFSRLAFIRNAWFCMRYFHLVACSYVIMFFCLTLPTDRDICRAFVRGYSNFSNYFGQMLSILKHQSILSIFPRLTNKFCNRRTNDYYCCQCFFLALDISFTRFSV